MGERCESIKELASATCYLFLLAHHLIFLSRSLSFVLVFHPSVHLAFSPLPPKSHNSPLMPACNQISSVLGAALVLSATHPSDPMSPAGSLPPSDTFIALPCRHILPSSTATMDLPPSQISPPLLMFREQSARKVPLWLSWPPLIHPLSVIWCHCYCSVSVLLHHVATPSSLCEVSLASLLIVNAQFVRFKGI